jgi:hypothetical protein
LASHSMTSMKSLGRLPTADLTRDVDVRRDRHN